MIFITNNLLLTFEVDRQYLKFSTVGLGMQLSKLYLTEQVHLRIVKIFFFQVSVRYEIA